MTPTRVVDLTRTIQSSMQMYPGDPAPQRRQLTTIAKDGFVLHELTLGSETGTTINSSGHTMSDGQFVGDIALDRLCVRADIIDATDVDPNGEVDSGLLDDIELSPHKAVLVRTDWDRYEETDQAWAHPALSDEFARKLAAANVAFVGVDFACVDAHGSDLPIHQILGSADVPIVEGLTNLKMVTWFDPLIVVAPLAWPDLTGAPIRALAIEMAG